MRQSVGRRPWAKKLDERTMMTRPGCRALASLAALATLASTAWAQENETPAPAGFGLGLSAVYQRFSEDFEGLDPGFGGEASVRYTWDGGFQLLGGVHYSRHDILRLPGNVGFLEFFVDPRYVIELFDSQRIVLLVAGRVGYVKLSNGDTDTAVGGATVGGSVGGLYGLRRTLAVEVTFYFGGLWAERLQTEPGSAPTINGSITSIQVGVVWSFPS